MILNLIDYVIVVEVTLSTNSRQEAMEGEPVRRHVADLVQKYKKPVYGLFVANKIDSNTERHLEWVFGIQHKMTFGITYCAVNIDTI